MMGAGSSELGRITVFNLVRVSVAKMTLESLMSVHIFVCLSVRLFSSLTLDTSVLFTSEPDRTIASPSAPLKTFCDVSNYGATEQ